MSHPLWPHQVYGIEQVKEAIGRGCKRILLTSPTGGGKSRMVCELIEWASQRLMRPILYSNRKMLIEQLIRTLDDHGIPHGVRAAGYENLRGRDVQISSMPTEASKVIRSEKWMLHNGKLAIVDEAHLMKEATAQEIQRRHLASGAVWLGVTATPIALGHMYDDLIVAGKVSELRKCGALVVANHYGPDEPDMKNFKPNIKTGEFTEGQVRKAIMTKNVFGRVYGHWLTLNPDALPTILFAPGVGESIWFAEQFQSKGVKAAHIDGKNCWVEGELVESSPEVRRQIVGDIKTGRIHLVCNRFVLREGIDIPELRHGIFATVYGSLQSYLQSGGRLLRACQGKDRVTVQDHGGNWHRHGSLNSDREWQLNATATMISGEREESMRLKRTQEPICCPKCFALRSNGAECPKCHFITHKKSRMVVQQNGTLKELTGDIFKPRQTRMKSDTLRIWEQCYYRAKRSRNGMNFRQAEALFFHENHYWPPRDLPYMPKDHMDMYRRVADVPVDKLHAREAEAAYS